MRFSRLRLCNILIKLTEVTFNAKRGRTTALFDQKKKTKKNFRDAKKVDAKRNGERTIWDSVFRVEFRRSRSRWKSEGAMRRGPVAKDEVA